MSPSRRQVLGTVGTAVAVSGCTAFESTPETETEQPVETAVRARLVGPDTDQLLFDGSDIERVGEVNERSGIPQLPLELSDAATASVSEQFRAANISENPGQFEIRMLDEDGQFNEFSISPGLAENIEAGEWDGEFVLTLEDRDSAEAVRAQLRGEDQGTPAQ